MPKGNHHSEELEIIIETAADLETSLRQAIAALIKQCEVFRRGRVLVYPDRSVMIRTKRGSQPHLAIQLLNVANLRRFLCRAAQFMKPTRKNGLVPVLPSKDLCTELLDYVANKPMGLPALNGVMTTPFLRADLSLCQEPGYDARSSVFYDPCGTMFPPMPKITPDNACEMAQAALKRLANPLRGYVFDNDISKAVTIAMLLSAFTVHITRTRPGFLIDAPVFGSGKTMLIELVVLLLTGHDPALLSLANMTARDELEKQLDTALLRGEPCILLDNARGDLAKFGKLVTLLTAAKIGVRLFHTQIEAAVENNFIISVSGNNVSTSADMARRFMRARIDTGLEHPDRKQFHFDPRDEVLVQRPKLCMDALTILIAYQIAGAPLQRGRPYGSYVEWTRIVRDALMWLGLPDIVPSNDDATIDDQDRSDLLAVLQLWNTTPSLVSVELTVEELIEDASLDTNAALKGALLAVAADKKGRDTINSRRLGWWFKRNVGRRVENLALAKRQLDSKSRYKLVRYEDVL